MTEVDRDRAALEAATPGEWGVSNRSVVAGKDMAWQHVADCFPHQTNTSHIVRAHNRLPLYIDFVEKNKAWQAAVRRGDGAAVVMLSKDLDEALKKLEGKE